jgi:prolipoprotein diacylglyceryltransferase
MCSKISAGKSCVKTSPFKHGLISRFEVSYPVHPVQAYLVISMFILFLILFIMNRFKVRRNIIAGSALIGYGTINFK